MENVRKTKTEVDVLKKYDSVFILDEHFVEDQGRQFSDELLALVKSLGGEMVNAVSMGRKQFTYEVRKKKAGAYWNFVFEIKPGKISDIKEKYKLDERILRMRIYDYNINGKKAGVEDV